MDRGMKYIVCTARDNSCGLACSMTVATEVELHRHSPGQVGREDLWGMRRVV